MSGQWGKKIKISIKFLVVQIFNFNPWKQKLIGGKTMPASVTKSGELLNIHLFDTKICRVVFYLKSHMHIPISIQILALVLPTRQTTRLLFTIH